MSLTFLLLCFIPSYSNWNLKSSYFVTQLNINSLGFQLSVLGGIVIALAELVTIVMDGFLTSRRAIRMVYLSWEAVGAILLPNLLILTVIIPSGNYRYIPCIVHAQQIFYVHFFLSNIHKFGSKFWFGSFMSIIGFLVSLGVVLNCFWEFTPGDNNGFLVTPMILLILATILYGWLCYRWLKYLFTSSSAHIKQAQAICNSYVLSFAVYIVGNWVIYFAYRYNNNELRYHTAHNYLFIAMSITISASLSTSARMHLVHNEHVLERKRLFLLYVSHGIRTPLNTAVLGLKLLYDELLQIRHEDMEDFLSTLDEIKTSCSNTITFLDDLLAYDTIEGGISEPNLQVVGAWSFIRDTVRPYLAPGNSTMRGIVVLDIPSEVVAQIRKFCVRIDRNTMGHVFRSLISMGMSSNKAGNKVIIKVRRIAAAGSPSANSADAQAVNAGNAVMKRPRVEMLRISIIDQGPGLSMEAQAKMFKDMASRMFPSDSEGSGLGLWIAKGIIDSHGGTLSMNSKGVGQGCTIAIDLPLIYKEPRPGRAYRDPRKVYDFGDNNDDDHGEEKSNHAHLDVPAVNSRTILNTNAIAPQSSPMLPTREDSQISSGRKDSGEPAPTNRDSMGRQDSAPTREETAVVATAPADGGSGGAGTGDQMAAAFSWSGLRVLVVDDAPLNRKMLARVIRGRCLECLEASDGLEAVALVTTGLDNNAAADVILMDYQMPNMDGPTASSKMRSLGYDGVIIGVTGNSLQSDMNNFVSHGADRVMTKPLDLTALESVLEELLAA